MKKPRRTSASSDGNPFIGPPSMLVPWSSPGHGQGWVIGQQEARPGDRRQCAGPGVHRLRTHDRLAEDAVQQAFSDGCRRDADATRDRSAPQSVHERWSANLDPKVVTSGWTMFRGAGQCAVDPEAVSAALPRRTTAPWPVAGDARAGRRPTSRRCRRSRRSTRRANPRVSASDSVNRDKRTPQDASARDTR